MRAFCAYAYGKREVPKIWSNKRESPKILNNKHKNEKFKKKVFRCP